MKLSDLLPPKERKKEGWVIKSDYLMYRKLNLIPMAYISENQVYVILDLRIKNKVLSLIEHLTRSNIHFFLTVEDVSNPSYKDDINEKIVEHTLNIYLQEDIVKKLEDIGFDLMGRLVEWSKKEDCFYLIKTELDILINKYESMTRYDNKQQEKVSKLKILWRQIQIDELLL
jgi:hypothetical protein